MIMLRDLWFDTPWSSVPCFMFDRFLKERPQDLLRESLAFTSKMVCVYVVVFVRLIIERDCVADMGSALERSVGADELWKLGFLSQYSWCTTAVIEFNDDGLPRVEVILEILEGVSRYLGSRNRGSTTS